MITEAPQPPHEAVDDELQRLAALHALALLDTPPEPVFDAVTAAAAQICGAPMALVSLMDADRQWFKSNVGLPGVTETPREVAFCDHAIRSDDLLEVPDATLDPRFAANPFVTGDAGIRFYAGAPIVLAGGERIGTVCVIDRMPRQLDAAQRATLESLGRIVSASLSERTRLLAMTRELAQSEARYRAIVEEQTELISLARRDGTLTFVNGAYARHFGLEPAQMIGRNLLDFVAEADKAEVAAHLEKVCSDSRGASGVNRMAAADGRIRWVAWSNRPIEDGQGQVVAVQSVGRDISEQRAAELALAESEQRYRRLYESTPAILHSIDSKGRLLNVSDRWLEVLGYARSEVIGRASSEFLEPASRRRAVEEVLPAFFETGRCDRIEYQFVRKDGTLVDMLLSGTLERDEHGRPFRSLAVMEDVTETKRLASELGRTHAHLDAIVDNVPAMLGYWDRDGITRFANRELQDAIGLPVEHIVDRPLFELLGRIDAAGLPKIAPQVHAVLGGRRQEFDCGLLTTTGLRQLRVTLVPGQGGGFHGLWYDITGRKALELRLTESEQRYRSLFDHLSSGFALHDIIVDAQGRAVDCRFLAMNEAFATMTGIDPVRAIGRRMSEVLPAAVSGSAARIEVFGRVAMSGESAHFEERLEALGRWLDVVAYRPAAGQFAVITQDITQRKKAEAALALAGGAARLDSVASAPA